MRLDCLLVVGGLGNKPTVITEFRSFGPDSWRMLSRSHNYVHVV